MTAIHSVRHWDTGAMLAVEVCGGRITAITPIAHGPAVPVIIPTLFDLQINGGLGVDFSNPAITIDDVQRVIARQRAAHVGGMLATLISGSNDATRSSLANLVRVLDADAEMARMIAGFHLEGPYISGEDGFRGAHPREHLRDPDWDEFRRWQDAAGGRIRLITLAPERAGAIECIGKLCADHVVCAIGHTAANAETIHAAVDAGATFSTHLGNGCAAMLPRHDNPIWLQLARDDLGASIITDGFHLPDALIRVFLRVKTPARLVLTCDASPLAGMPAGRHHHWGTDVEISPAGRIGVAGTPFLAGSGANLWDCVRYLVDNFGLPLKDAVTMAGINPRAWLGLPIPALAVGADWSDFTRIAPMAADAAQCPPS